MNTWLISGVIILVILLLLFLLLKVNSYLRDLAYKKFIEVEKMYVDGHGEDKMNECVEYIEETLNSISFFGPIITIFLNATTLKKILQKFFDEIKNFLDDGKFN